MSLAPRPFALSAVPLLAAAALWSSPAQAGGDNVYGTRSGEELEETGHEIELSFERGYVELKVERTVFNPIARHDQALMWLDLPVQAVATSLSTLGERNGRPHWYAGELLEAEAAAERYRELTGIGGYYPKDPALLSWRSQGELCLQVFPVAPQTEKSVSYTLEMPAYWEGGQWHVSLPSLGSPEHPAEIRIDPAEQLDQLFVDGQVVARGHYLLSDHEVELALAPRDPKPLSLSMASIPTGKRHLAQWRVSLAPELSKLPQDARVVVLIDVSRSRSQAELEAERGLALAYLEHFGDPELAAQVSVLAFDREVHELSPGFVPAAEARALLEQASLVRRNGSELGLALREAAARIGEQRARDNARVLVISDYETAARVSPQQLGADLQLGEGILHFVEPVSEGDPELSRADGHAWSSLAARSGGVAWTATASADWAEPGQRSEAVQVFEELARPLRIDQFRVYVDGMTDPWGYTSAALDYADTMPEGEGVEGLEISTAPATRLRVEGLLWNQPLSEEVGPSREEADRWSALVFGTDLMHELDEDEMMVLAMRGGAVSPVTSYLAIEPGVRPSTEGLDWTGGVGEGFGSASSFGFGARGRMMRGAGSPPDKQGWLEQELREGWARCGGGSQGGELALETESTELLDATLTSAASDAKLRACMEQVTWSLELPSFFSSRERWTVTL